MKQRECYDCGEVQYTNSASPGYICFYCQEERMEINDRFCHKCGKKKPISCFCGDSYRSQTGKKYLCKECENEKSNIKRRISLIRQRVEARKNG